MSNIKSAVCILINCVQIFYHCLSLSICNGAGFCIAAYRPGMLFVFLIIMFFCFFNRKLIGSGILPGSTADLKDITLFEVLIVPVKIQYQTAQIRQTSVPQLINIHTCHIFCIRKPDFIPSIFRNGILYPF